MQGTGDWQIDYVRVTGRSDPLELARWLEGLDPAFTWEAGRPTRRYAASLVGQGGVVLAYARRNADGLDAPQSDSRDSSDWCLEVPGRWSGAAREALQRHPACGTMQAPRVDVCRTWRPDDPAHVYAVVRELIAHDFGRPAHRIGPDGAEWEGVTIQTHARPAEAARAVVLYDKHAQSPDEYPTQGTIRLEVRLQPDKAPDKRRCFWESPERLLDSWRFARRLREVLEGQPRGRSWAWHQACRDGELDRLTRHLLASYGRTIFRGIARDGVAYLHRLAWAAILLEAEAVAGAYASRGMVSLAPERGQVGAVDEPDPVAIG